jgi:hypothetical protein
MFKNDKKLIQEEINRNLLKVKFDNLEDLKIFKDYEEIKIYFRKAFTYYKKA